MSATSANLILRLAGLATFAAVLLAGEASDPATIAAAVGGIVLGVGVPGPGTGE